MGTGNLARPELECAREARENGGLGQLYIGTMAGPFFLRYRFSELRELRLEPMRKIWPGS